MKARGTATRWPWRTALAVLVATAGAREPWAQGGPPMLTDDPDTPGNGRWEINIAVTETRSAGERVRSLPHVDLNYGWGECVQLKYETGFQWQTSGAQGHRSGMDDGLLGLKWRFIDHPDAGMKVSTYPQLQVENSRSSVRRGIADTGPNLFLPIEASRHFGSGAVVGEVGRQWNHAEPDGWVYGILGALTATEGLELLAEYRHVGRTLAGGGAAILNLGLRARLADHVTMLAALGRGVAGGDSGPRWIAYVGAQLALGR